MRARGCLQLHNAQNPVVPRSVNEVRHRFLIGAQPGTELADCNFCGTEPAPTFQMTEPGGIHTSTTGRLALREPKRLARMPQALGKLENMDDHRPRIRQ